MFADEADEEIVSWLADPPKHAPKLTLRGSPGVGKTALLAGLHEELPGSFFLDCRGLTADQVLGRLLDHFGLQVRRRPLGDPLKDTLAGLRRGGILFLANVQWAGTLHSSAEPDLIDRVVGEFSSQGRGRVLPVLELGEPSDQDQGQLPHEILLEAEGPASTALLDEHPALRALAATELREIPLRVWEFMDSTLGGQHTEDALRHVVRQLPDALRLEVDGSGTSTVRLASDGLKCLLRKADPITEAEQSAITDALLSEVSRTSEGTADVRITAYAGHALAVHAALAGTLPRLIDEEPVLVAIADRVSLLQAIKLSWPGGTPVGGTAADAHYLDSDGVAPGSQSEWLAWLHWAAVNRGHREWADRLENASPVPLAWRTAWSKWRPYGVLEVRPDLPAPARGVAIGTYTGTPVVASEHSGVFSQEELEGALGDGQNDWGDDQVRERVWRLSDGEELLEPRVVHQFISDEGDVERTVGSALASRRYVGPSAANRPDWPGLLTTRSGAEAADEGRWVAYGSRGLYAFDVLHPEALTPGPGVWQRSLVPSFRSTALWPMPTPVAEQGEALNTWFTTAFGGHALRRLPVADLPTDLSEPRARTILSDTGFPALDGTAPAFLTTVAIDQTGLARIGGPDSPEASYLLGHWLTEPIVLEGHTGRVLLASVTGTELLGSDLSLFMTLVGLYRLLRLSDFPLRSDEGWDARRSVKAWARVIDPEATASSHWQGVLDGRLDNL
ncbi:SUKH-4 family immunity protein [Streptomyces fulvoviolaceus]|uniref:SUKH-4 family immunity protein n=1 Tax=Streptomyces fulvoviolaceus TaxID=285535 RepID=UPI0004C4D742|nr:SUKH-4 family immunity protein [Streptomyces fulvoviolaceus]MCT9079505.1 SUKH-4 family immunity protein [Streptomyces fulvoviolaceus]